jgi:hypothetical protein
MLFSRLLPLYTCIYYRNGHFQVLEAEPSHVQRDGLDRDVPSGSGNVAILPQNTSPLAHVAASESGLAFARDNLSMSEGELDAMRNHLENLLP